MEKIDWNALRPAMGEMDPSDSMPFGNPYDLVYGAQQVGRDQPALKNASAGASSEPLVIPPAPPGLATRVIVDLGVLHNGWLAFDAEGRHGSLPALARLEGLEPGPPARIQWAGGSACATWPVGRNSMELSEEDPRFRGLVPSEYPSTWESQIPMWAFHRIMWCRDYYWQTAEMGFAQRIMPRVAAGIREGLDKI